MSEKTDYRYEPVLAVDLTKMNQRRAILRIAEKLLELETRLETLEMKDQKLIILPGDK